MRPVCLVVAVVGVVVFVVDVVFRIPCACLHVRTFNLSASQHPCCCCSKLRVTWEKKPFVFMSKLCSAVRAFPWEKSSSSTE